MTNNEEKKPGSIFPKVSLADILIFTAFIAIIACLVLGIVSCGEPCDGCDCYQGGDSDVEYERVDIDYSVDLESLSE